MSEHYPKSAIGQEIYAWCDICRRDTKHMIVAHTENAGRLGHCLEHNAQLLTRKQQARLRKETKERQNPRLF